MSCLTAVIRNTSLLYQLSREQKNVSRSCLFASSLTALQKCGYYFSLLKLMYAETISFLCLRKFEYSGQMLSVWQHKGLSQTFNHQCHLVASVAQRQRGNRRWEEKSILGNGDYHQVTKQKLQGEHSCTKKTWIYKYTITMVAQGWQLMLFLVTESVLLCLVQFHFLLLLFFCHEHDNLSLVALLQWI